MVFDSIGLGLFAEDLVRQVATRRGVRRTAHHESEVGFWANERDVPFVIGRNGVRAPMDEDAELCVFIPLRSFMAPKRFGGRLVWPGSNRRRGRNENQNRTGAKDRHSCLTAYSSAV